MKKTSLLLIILLAMASCSRSESNLLVNGKVQDLKKGTLYLQSIKDTALVNIDSIVINGDATFSFETYIEHPQVLYLYLDKIDGSNFDDRLLFFAEPGEMTINTTLKNFETDVVVEGSENHKKLMEYRQMMERFNSRNLDLIQANLEARQQNDQAAIDSTRQQHDNLLKRRYLFTVNYAINNKDSEIAPYLAISEIFDANIKYLDTIYKSLTPKVKSSLYGKSLETYLDERRQDEQQHTQEEGDQEQNTPVA